MIQYMTIPEAAVLWETNPTAIRVGCVEHQIGGAVRFGRSWLIPENTPRPQAAYGFDRNDTGKTDREAQYQARLRVNRGEL